jgi:hypothetical protein
MTSDVLVGRYQRFQGRGRGSSIFGGNAAVLGSISHNHIPNWQFLWYHNVIFTFHSHIFSFFLTRKQDLNKGLCTSILNGPERPKLHPNQYFLKAWLNQESCWKVWSNLLSAVPVEHFTRQTEYQRPSNKTADHVDRRLDRATKASHHCCHRLHTNNVTAVVTFDNPQQFWNRFYTTDTPRYERHQATLKQGKWQTEDIFLYTVITKGVVKRAWV